MEVCAGDFVGVESAVKLGGRVESANGFVVCPDGFEAGFVEGGVGFAETVIVFVVWGVGFSGGEVEGRWVGCGRGIESFGVGDLLRNRLEGNWRTGCYCRCGLWAPLNLRLMC